jgi:hypothetical protein
VRGLSVVEFVWSLSGGWLWSGICLILVALERDMLDIGDAARRRRS